VDGDLQSALIRNLGWRKTPSWTWNGCMGFGTEVGQSYNAKTKLGEYQSLRSRDS
jgi:hypothetical protein